MTRDEAVQKLVFDAPNSSGQTARLVDSLVALGLLKLDTRAEELTRCAAIERLTNMFVTTVSPGALDGNVNGTIRRLNTEGATEIIDILTKS